MPTDHLPAEAFVCNKHREVYRVRRDALKCCKPSCYDLRIELNLAVGAVRELRLRLHERLLHSSHAPSGLLNSRGSTKIVSRSIVDTSKAVIGTNTSYGEEDPAPFSGSTVSLSSSGMSIRDLILAGLGEDPSAPPRARTSATQSSMAGSFAQNVRLGAKSIAAKSAALDASQWAAGDNIMLQ